MNTITHFHTHPSNQGASDYDVYEPSGQSTGRGDLQMRDDQKQYFKRFIILARNRKGKGAEAIDYTDW